MHFSWHFTPHSVQRTPCRAMPQRRPGWREKSKKTVINTVIILKTTWMHLFKKFQKLISKIYLFKKLFSKTWKLFKIFFNNFITVFTFTLITISRWRCIVRRKIVWCRRRNWINECLEGFFVHVSFLQSKNLILINFLSINLVIITHQIFVIEHRSRYRWCEACVAFCGRHCLFLFFDCVNWKEN